MVHHYQQTPVDSEDETDTSTVVNMELQDSREKGRKVFYDQLCNLKYKLILYLILIFIFGFEIFREVLLENFLQKFMQKWDNSTIMSMQKENNSAEI